MTAKKDTSFSVFIGYNDDEDFYITNVKDGVDEYQNIVELILPNAEKKHQVIDLTKGKK